MNFPSTKSRPVVSVAMPFYNAAATLAVAARSILEQSFSNFELLLCNDGSTDQGLQVAESLSFADPRVVVWSHSRRAGLAARLNECVEGARGEYFARMDADDISYPERIRKQVRFLEERRDVDLVGTHMLVFRGDGDAVGKIAGPTAHEEIARQPHMGVKVWHATWCGRIGWFRRNRYDARCRLAQDQELLFRAHRTSRYAAIPELLYANRVERLELRKMLRYRWLWMRYMSRHLRGLQGFATGVGVAALLGAKACVDTFSVASGLDYKILRHRGARLSERELVEWELVRRRFFHGEDEQRAFVTAARVG
jgi:glycosyltransferase involved in cell wall biosynthesis